MCGRFALVEPVPEIARLFGIAVRDLDDWLERPGGYNIAPQSDVIVIRAGPAGGRQGALLRWGLVPGWAREAGVGARMFNARLEGVRERPAYRGAFARRRCLVPASAFYEWRRSGEDGKTRQPFAFRAVDRRPLALAGIWEANGRLRAPDQDPFESVAILTTEARGVVASLHDRMPLIVPAASWSAWLAPDTPGSEVDALAGAAAERAADALDLYAVTTRMNSARFTDPACLEPLGETAP